MHCACNEWDDERGTGGGCFILFQLQREKLRNLGVGQTHVTATRT